MHSYMLMSLLNLIVRASRRPYSHEAMLDPSFKSPEFVKNQSDYTLESLLQSATLRLFWMFFLINEEDMVYTPTCPEAGEPPSHPAVR